MVLTHSHFQRSRFCASLIEAKSVTVDLIVALLQDLIQMANMVLKLLDFCLGDAKLLAVVLPALNCVIDLFLLYP